MTKKLETFAEKGKPSSVNKLFQIVPDMLSDDSPSSAWNQFDKPDPYPVKIARPSPGACIKTWLENGDKVFINVCHSSDIKAPEDITDAELEKVLTDESLSYIIPVAIGEEKYSIDKDNIERSTFDVLINTSYFEKCKKKDLFWKFTITVILGSIKEKYNKPLKEEYRVLTHKKVMGTLQTFSIQDREVKKPEKKKILIEEIKLPERANKNYEFLQKVLSDGNKLTYGYYNVPAEKVEDIKVSAKSDRVLVENKKKNFFEDHCLPLDIDPDNVEATYDSALQILEIKMRPKVNL